MSLTQVQRHEAVSNASMTLELLCGIKNISLNSSFWNENMRQLAFDLHTLGPELHLLEQEMLKHCHKFVQNNIKSRNFSVLLQFMTKFQFGRVIATPPTTGRDELIITMNLLLLIRVFLKYFIEVQTLEEFASHFDSISNYYSTDESGMSLVCICHCFLSYVYFMLFCVVF